MRGDGEKKGARLRLGRRALSSLPQTIFESSNFFLDAGKKSGRAAYFESGRPLFFEGADLHARIARRRTLIFLRQTFFGSLNFFSCAGKKAGEPLTSRAGARYFSKTPT
ncbi:MAG: hypothetical protein IJ668_13045, partial [Selenomonadaceae bacterium]|nr:hypothetical protein [Selenomonadaceae bacterium]